MDIQNILEVEKIRECLSGNKYLLDYFNGLILLINKKIANSESDIEETESDDSSDSDGDYILDQT